MKKLLLSLLTIFCAVGFANAETETVVMQGQTVTYNNGQTEVLGTATITVSAAKHFESVTLGELFTLIPEKGTGSNYPAYNKDKTFRIYGGNTFTIKAVDGINMTKIEFNAVTTAGTPNPSVGSYNTKVWTSTDPVSEVTFTNTGSGQFTFTSLTITYEQAGVVIVKEDAGMSFPEKEYEANLGEAFTAPALTKATTAPVTYTSSDETVATVDAATGAVTPLAVGYTTIKATAEENDDFKAGMAEYQLRVVDPNANEVTFDFLKNDYGMIRSANTYTTDITFSEGKVSAEITNISGNGIRMWTDGLRFYKGENKMTLSVPAGYAINKVVFVANAAISVSYGGNMLTDNTWTGEDRDVTFVLNASDNKAVSSITVSFEPSTVAPKEDAGMSFPAEEYEANLGEAFTAPELTKATTAPVTYTSSDETVATVDAATGAVTLLAVGYTTIKATAEENDAFKAGMAEYQLKVVDPNANEVTFDFKNNDYGMVRGNSSIYNSEKVEFAEGEVTAILTTEETNATRLWDDGLRIYKNKQSDLTLSVPNGFAINKVVFVGATGISFSVDGVSLSDDYTWTGEKREVTFSILTTATKAITSITVSFAPATIAENPEVPVTKIDGQEITDEYTLAGEEVELTFETAEGTSIWYKFTPAVAPAAEEDADNDGYTKLEGNTLKVGNPGILSYYAEANGLKSEVSTITFNGIPAGIEAIEADTNAAAEYFTIQGVKANAETLVPGLYIRRAGNKVSKVIVK